MKKTLMLALSTLMIGQTANASTIAVIDSGTDMQHEQIQPKAWMNEAEIAGNDRDEDRNGYQDDIFGWNFAESNNKVIDYSYLGVLTDDIRRFFEIQTKIFFGTNTEEEITWIRAKVEDQDFIKQIGIYGNFMHGTHVGAITVKGNRDAKLLAVKLIPTEVKLPGQESQKGAGMWLLKKALKTLAKAQMDAMEEIGVYINGHKADIANGSFGTGFPQAKMIVGGIIKTFSKNPKPEDIEEGAKYFLSQLVIEGKRMVEAAPNTLFVFAAGNDGLNNDEFPTSPTNIQADNVISVGASLDRNELANFSNYGEKMVDVAAPGVNIKSASPGNKYIAISGTSQAAPYVARIAGLIKDMNPTLSPGEIKKIILGTVDRKKFLEGKIKTSGIVNRSRATKAAEMSLYVSVEQAISGSIDQVQDVPVQKIKKSSSSYNSFVLPLPSNFKMLN